MPSFTRAILSREHRSGRKTCAEPERREDTNTIAPRKERPAKFDTPIKKRKSLDPTTIRLRRENSMDMNVFREVVLTTDVSKIFYRDDRSGSATKLMADAISPEKLYPTVEEGRVRLVEGTTPSTHPVKSRAAKFRNLHNVALMVDTELDDVDVVTFAGLIERYDVVCVSVHSHHEFLDLAAVARKLARKTSKVKYAVFGHRFIAVVPGVHGVPHALPSPRR